MTSYTEENTGYDLEAHGESKDQDLELHGESKRSYSQSTYRVGANLISPSTEYSYFMYVCFMYFVLTALYLHLQYIYFRSVYVMFWMQINVFFTFVLYLCCILLNDLDLFLLMFTK